jgi:Fur family ferric uptake transcriptional regulator
MPTSTDEHISDLQSSGLKATLPRIKVLDVFQQSAQQHLSAEDVYKRLINRGSDIGLATVYRVLMQFEQAGLLTRNQFEAGKAVFELNKGAHHDHMVCMSCGHIEEFVDPEIEQRQREIAKARGFKLQEHVLVLYGLCSRPECRASTH